ncbi:MAG: hypothetical protein GY856_55640 [bacterium]|nr:hypothetical protein [bacterium]
MQTETLRAAPGTAEAKRSAARPSLDQVSTVEFIAHLHRADVELWAEGDRLRFSAPKGALTPALRDQLVKRKGEVLQFLHGTMVAAEAGAPALEPVPRTAPLPLSFAQERMWFFDRYQPRSSAYNMSTLFRLRGRVHLAALRASLDEIVRRHEILRTTFADDGGQPEQVIAPRLVVELPVIDLGDLPASGREAAGMRLARSIAQRPFDLTRGPLLRLALVRLAAAEHLFVFTIPHIVADGWSSGILANGLLVLYDALLDPRASPGPRGGLPELPIQYADFAHWQRRWLQDEVFERQLGYWRTQLEGAPQLLALSTDRPRPAVPSYAGGKQARCLPGSLHQALETLCQGAECTPFMAFVATFNVLLRRYSGARDLLVGTPIANRNRVELEGLIGFFANPGAAHAHRSRGELPRAAGAGPASDSGGLRASGPAV